MPILVFSTGHLRLAVRVIVEADSAICELPCSIFAGTGPGRCRRRCRARTPMSSEVCGSALPAGLAATSLACASAARRAPTGRALHLCRPTAHPESCRPARDARPFGFSGHHLHPLDVAVFGQDLTALSTLG